MDPPARMAPAAVSTAPVASMPITIDRCRGGISEESRDQGARPRAAPRPPATSASRNAAITACQSEGATSAVRLATAIAPASRA